MTSKSKNPIETQEGQKISFLAKFCVYPSAHIFAHVRPGMRIISEFPRLIQRLNIIIPLILSEFSENSELISKMQNGIKQEKKVSFSKEPEKPKISFDTLFSGSKILRRDISKIVLDHGGDYRVSQKVSYILYLLKLTIQ